MTFAAWMAEVDRALEALCGLSSACLADYAYRDAYDNEEDPQDVAAAVLEEEGFPCE